MIKKIFALLLAMMIPVLLFGTVWQSYRYTVLSRDISRLERKQYVLIEENRRIISEISVLSTPERIERVAVEDLLMRKAKTNEIMRISLSEGGLGG